MESVVGGCKSVVCKKEWSSSLRSSMDLESDLDLLANLAFKSASCLLMLEKGVCVELEESDDDGSRAWCRILVASVES